MKRILNMVLTIILLFVFCVNPIVNAQVEEKSDNDMTDFEEETALN